MTYWHEDQPTKAEEIGIGLVVGLVLTMAAAQLLKIALHRKWLTPTWIQIPVIALALGCFALAQLLGGSGFIAAFSGGLLFGALAKDEHDKFLLAGEGTGDTLALITWVIFGAAVVAQAVGNFSWSILLSIIAHGLTAIPLVAAFAASIKRSEKP